MRPKRYFTFGWKSERSFSLACSQSNFSGCLAAVKSRVNSVKCVGSVAWKFYCRVEESLDGDVPEEG